MIKNTIDISQRTSKEYVCSFSRYDSNLNYLAFIQNLPDVLAGKSFKKIVKEFSKRRKNGKKNIVMLGAHVIKCGLQPYLSKMMECGLIDLLAINGATVIHDVEFALYGKTSENVSVGLLNKTYAAVNEPLDFINETLHKAPVGSGYGSSIGEALSKKNPAFAQQSLLRAAYINGVETTVHISIGTDINQLHKSFDCAKSATLSYRDFEIFTSHVQQLDGDMIFNCGSAVMLPEIFLKALTIVTNNDYSVQNFMGVNLDFNIQYRSNSQIVEKAELLGGQGYNLIGHHEIQIPLLFGALIQTVECDNNG